MRVWECECGVRIWEFDDVEVKMWMYECRSEDAGVKVCGSVNSSLYVT